MTDKIDYIKDDLMKLYGKFLWVSVFSLLAESVTSITDMIILGHYMGSDVIAAINICMPVYMLYNSCAMLIGAGGATVFAYFIGKNERENANSFFTSSIALSGGLSVLFAAAGLAFAPRISLALGANSEIYGYVLDYIRVIFAFSPVFMYYASTVFFVKYDGSPKLVFLSTLSCAAVNIALDVVFAGMLKMGAAGGALATSLGYVSASAVITLHFFRKNNLLKLVKLRIKNTFRTLSAGLPLSATQFGMFVTTSVFNIVLISGGSEDYVAIYAVITQLSLIGLAVYEGSAGAAQPIIAANYGAKEPLRIKGIFKIGMATEIAAAILCTIVYFASAPLLARLFSITQPATISQTASGIRAYSLAMPFTGINVFIMYFFQAKEKTAPALVISILRNSALMIISLYAVIFLFGKNGVWWCWLVSETLTLAISLILFSRERKTTV